MNEKVLFIGLFEENRKRNIIKATKELFLLSGFEVVYERTQNIIGFSNDKITIIVFDLLEEELCNINFNNLCFDIVVHSFIKEYCKDNIVNLFKKSRVCIYNSDEEDLMPFLSNLGSVIAINYGFNNKATLTISSYNVKNLIEVNLCLQRDIVPFCGEKIEPFEFPIFIKSNNEKDVYPVLAAVALNLIIGASVFNQNTYKNINLNIL